MKFVCLYTYLLMSVSVAQASEPITPESRIFIGGKYSFHSELLDEKQIFRVALPRSYDGTGPGVSYPVVYVLDGHEDQFRSMAETARANNLFGARMPAVIVVGVPSNSRQRDYTPIHSTKGYDGKPSKALEVSGGGDSYRQYLKDEFFPLIERQFRTNGHRILVGHSLGASFALHDLMRKDRLFHSYIAIDPNLWGGDWYLGKQAEALHADGSGFGGRLFLSFVPRQEEMSRAPVEIAKIKSGIMAVAAESMAINVKPFAEENHQSILPLGFLYGLRHVFLGYEPPSFEAVAHDPSVLVEHFEKYSRQLGIRYLPDPVYINIAAYSALNDYKLMDNALKLYLLNTELYPERSNSWGALGYYYEQIGNGEKAIEASQKALKLDPENIWAQQRIERLSE